jgi:hypothetical protein
MRMRASVSGTCFTHTAIFIVYPWIDGATESSFPYPSNFLRSNAPLVPPKPKEFVSA